MVSLICFLLYIAKKHFLLKEGPSDREQAVAILTSSQRNKEDCSVDDARRFDLVGALDLGYASTKRYPTSDGESKWE